MTPPFSQDALTIRQAEISDIPLIQRVVEAAWPVAFGEILTPEFLAHELKRVYSAAALRHLMADEELFLMAETGGELAGFAAYRVAGCRAKLEKLYLMPGLKGQGYGKALILDVVERVTKAGATDLQLNVNRSNPAVRFYQRMGFVITREEDVEVGPNFFRNDYVMCLALNG